MESLFEHFGLQIKEARPSNKKRSKYADEISAIRRWFENIDEINGVMNSKSLKTLDLMDEIRPEIGQILEHKVNFYDEHDEDGSAELSALNYLFVVWWSAFSQGCRPQEIKQILQKEINDSYIDVAL